eukprot:TRINITY_DN543_c0_g2_i1.p1 TRINITY_DN543_c0_g2~~TRINITY_DN543_c0_g2_i1.p1  ORF type:complete len:159 (-),score=19.54 TRINITY_DN543_c0_g2_i1:109-585(-)
MPAHGGISLKTETTAVTQSTLARAVITAGWARAICVSVSTRKFNTPRSSKNNAASTANTRFLRKDTAKNSSQYANGKYHQMDQTGTQEIVPITGAQVFLTISMLRWGTANCSSSMENYFNFSTQVEDTSATFGTLSSILSKPVGIVKLSKCLEMTSDY